MRRINNPFAMRNPLRSLYAKIFLWFCLTIVITLIAVLVAVSLTGSQVLGRRWMSVTQDLYARSAVDFYSAGGTPQLSRYLDALAANSSIRGQLVDGSGHDVTGAPLDSDTSVVFAQTRQTNLSCFRLGRIWTAASPVRDGNSRPYIFLMAVHPMRGFLGRTFAETMLPRFALGILFVALFCLMLARHITYPIRILEDAATQLASGSLNVRASPRIAPRRDELARLAHAFDRMAERLQHLILAQQELLGHISHELRSPLARMGVSLELLRRAETEPPADPVEIERMQLDLDRLNQMIGEILHLTRVELTRMDQVETDQTAAHSLVDLAALLTGVADDARFESSGTGKRILFECDANCLVAGDESLLRSCFENIVRNALIYTPDNTAIRIHLASASDSTAVILIQDDGPGVPASALPHLFDLFYRVGSARQAHPAGTGFGLAIAQRIVTLHYGVISARNLSPSGLELRIELPIANG